LIGKNGARVGIDKFSRADGSDLGEAEINKEVARGKQNERAFQVSPFGLVS
jgi:hypothetical protein